MLPITFFAQFRAVPVLRKGDALWLAIGNAEDREAVNHLSAQTGLEVRPVLANPSSIEAVLARWGR